MHFGIVGAGAIGCLFGARLRMAGHDVTLVHHDPVVVRAIKRNGIRLQDLDRTLTEVRVSVRKGPTKLLGTDVLIIAVKAYDTRVVATSYRGIVPPETNILSLQNGLGNVETLQSSFKNEVLAASTTEGALSSGPGYVTHTGRGLTLVGPTGRTDSSLRIKMAFDGAGFRTRTSSNIRGVLWTKAIVNAAINPLSSLTRLPNGALAKNRVIHGIAQRAIDEGILVSHAARVRLVGDPRKLWRKILLSTKPNKSSMLQDIERGRTTEIRQLNGAIVSRGRRARIKTPVNEILTELVLGMEESSSTPMSNN
ncbi:MAG TPA: ketopantoate reductase family protein [Candidatus Bathyarchaeia archaeon]|nr:ketopantoate reductase family protein [Candidatus Bathyarchaeia archaeon]